MAVIIDDVEEFTRDWDWYAVDQGGYLGHFTSAGMRALPKSIKTGGGSTDRAVLLRAGTCDRGLVS